jgi:hypothetical protein
MAVDDGIWSATCKQKFNELAAPIEARHGANMPIASSSSVGILSTRLSRSTTLTSPPRRLSQGEEYLREQAVT